VRNDPYAVLGVARGASAGDIRQAYRKLAKELHPDTRPGDAASEERFKRVSAAFHLLSDPEKRRRFDRGEIDGDGNVRRANGGARPRGPVRPGAGPRPDEDLDTVFSSFFSGDARRGPFRTKGEDVRYRLEVDFVEAAEGGRRRVVMGDGKALELVIPEGVRTGAVLRLRGQGRPGQGSSPPGDALVEIEVLAHPIFERRGDDIWLELPISLAEAVQGGKVKAPTLSGSVALTIPKGSNSGQTLRLRGKGVRGEKGRGDLMVRLVVMLPERHDPELQRFVSEWRAAADYDPRRKLGR
jgi:DnaJ-class molecular chaperone